MSVLRWGYIITLDSLVFFDMTICIMYNARLLCISCLWLEHQSFVDSDSHYRAILQYSVIFNCRFAGGSKDPENYRLLPAWARKPPIT